ncbi:MAG: M48 family metallopeptidase [Armatimonadetes bacterium]|nr:M48 family metallopeptidase [Armatimonadota bacterium]
MRKHLIGLQASHFVSETDRKALEALKKLPVLPMLVQKFYEHGLDRWMYVHNMAMSVRCGPKQFKTIYEIHRECCAILDVPEPELYVSSNPFPNAFTGGVERPYIVLRSSILDTLTDDQIFDVIGHELGHIKAGHVLYQSIADCLKPLLEMVGRRTLGLGDIASIGILAAFREWSRQAEFTADRAGLLACQNLETAMGGNLALSAGPSRFSHEVNLDAYVDQARAYQEMSPADNFGKAIWFFMYGFAATHPMPVSRTKEIERWYLSGAYDNIINADFSKAS